jgi:hypothetical protein
MNDQFGRIYKSLNKEIDNLKDDFKNKELDLFKNGKLYFFINKTS